MTSLMVFHMMYLNILCLILAILGSRRIYSFPEKNRNPFEDCNGANNHFLDDVWNGGQPTSPEGSREKASGIAQKAAMEAKAASDAQGIAGLQAAHQVKVQLAEKAMQAAQAAQAALSGKLQIVEQLEGEVREAENVAQDESASLQQAQMAVQASSAIAHHSQQQLKLLSATLQLQQTNQANAEQAAQGAQQEFVEKKQLVEAAKHRVQTLLGQLSSSHMDFANTKQACNKAFSSAQEAKMNAARNRRKPSERIVG